MEPALKIKSKDHKIKNNTINQMPNNIDICF